jgi:uncharacterized protein (TIGR02145 family)
MKQLGLITIFMFGLNQFFAQTIMNIHQSNGTVLEIPLTEIDSINYTFPGGSGNGPTFDGHTYQTVVIGSQEWFAENLRTTVYANGDIIPHIVNCSDMSWNPMGWMNYMHNSQLDNPFGKLYNYDVVSDVRNACPTGWHIPSDNEWNILIDFLGGPTVAGGKMKSIGTEFWASPNQDATNESGFSALPGGSSDDAVGFYDFGQFGGYWSSGGYIVELNSFNGAVELYAAGGSGAPFYYSARCIKD